MKVRLLRDARINHKAGEILEVSPADAKFLVSVLSAELVETAVSVPAAETADKPKKTTRKRS